MALERGKRSSRPRGVSRLDDQRAARDAVVFEEVVARILEEVVGRDVNALKLSVEELVPRVGSVERLRKAARLAGARRGWKKTHTTKVIDHDGVEWLIMYEVGPDVRLVGGMDPRLRRALSDLASMLDDPG